MELEAGETAPNEPKVKTFMDGRARFIIIPME